MFLTVDILNGFRPEPADRRVRNRAAARGTDRWEPLVDEELPPDAVLAQGIEQGDDGALGAVMKRYWEALVRYVRRLVMDTDVATDIVQECFVKLWEGRDTIRTRVLRSYLYRAAHNLALDALRKQRVRQRWTISARISAEPDAEFYRSQAELRDTVDEAIMALPARRREVFTLAYLQGLSYQDIASVMSISTATVKNQLSAALAELRGTLSAHRPGYPAE